MQADISDSTTSAQPDAALEDVFVLPPSLAQRRLWLLHQIDPRTAVDVELLAVWLDGALDLPALEQSLNAVVRRHETLRTTMTLVNGLPMQVIALDATLALPLRDLRELSAAEREAAALRQARELARQPFDLSAGPLVRAQLFRLAADRHLLLLAVHQLAFDRWSRAVLLDELAEAYQALLGGRAVELPETGIQYADFAMWQTEWLQAEKAAQLAYWRTQLAGAPELRLPTDALRPPLQRMDAAAVTLRLPDALVAQLARLGDQAGVTLPVVLLAAFHALLQRYSGQDAIVVGQLVPSRSLNEIKRAIGLFAQMLPVRAQISEQDTFLELVAQVREALSAAQAHQDQPFAQIVDAVAPPRRLDRHPLFQALFVFDEALAARPLPGLTLRPLRLDPPATRLDLTLELTTADAGLDATLIYATELFAAGTISALLHGFQTLLQAVAADPALRLSALGARLAALPATVAPAIATPPYEQRPADVIAPRSDEERALAAIWSELLRCERVSVADDFFALGGDSLLAVQFAARVRDAFQVELPLRELFADFTLEQAALALARAAATPAERRATTIVMPAPDGRADAPELPGRAGSADSIIQRSRASYTELPVIMPDQAQRYAPFPLSDIQQAYWIGRSGAFAIGNVSNHLYMELESANLDIDRFSRAWQRVVDRHDMLRAIVLPDGQQQILKDVPSYVIEVSDLRDLDPQQSDAELANIRERMSHEVRRTDEWPLFAFRASRLADRIRLHISIDLLNVDVSSFGIFIPELARFYLDPTTELPALTLSFRDYVLAEIALRETEWYQRSQEYWFSRIPDLPAAPELPMLQSPSAISQPQFKRRMAKLDAERWRSLKTRALKYGLSASGVVLSAFAEALTAWSASPRFTINVTLFNRLPLHPEVGAVVGTFTSVNLLAIDNATPAAFELRARRIQERLWEDIDHAYISGIRVLREFGRVRGRADEALMPVVFTSTIGVVDHSNSELAGLAETVYSISQTSQVLLDHQVSENQGALHFNWDSVEDVFPAGMLDDMFDSYCRLLERLADDEDYWHTQTRRLVPQAQLERWAALNATDAPLPTLRAHDLFIAQAARQPQHAAVVSPEKTLTYQELLGYANRIGRRLRELGARPNQLVAIVMEKGWEQIAAVLGIVYAGAAYLPIDPQLPRERLWHLLEHGQVELALTQPALDTALEWPAQITRLCVTEALWADQADAAPAPSQPEDLIYVLYTSGSTGLPKGVMIEHRSVVNRVLDVNQRFAVGPGDRAIALTALHHDLSVYDIFGMLAAGGTIVVLDAARSRDPAHWAALMREAQVTLWNSVPAFMELLVEHLEGTDAAAAPDALRLVLHSGDWIPLTLPDRIRRLMPAAQVIGLGGPTETTVWDICYPIGELRPEWRSIPYGRPLTNARYHVLSAALEPRPAWTPGQLYIGGVGLARGYWRDPARTAEQFVPNPFVALTPAAAAAPPLPRTGDKRSAEGGLAGGEGGTRLYKSGDLGCYWPDGTIEIQGRIDFQVKLRGQRIELGEIEATLHAHPAVRSAVAAIVGDAGSRRLVAYVVRGAGVRDQGAGDPAPDGLTPDPRPPIPELRSLEQIEFKLSQPGLRQTEPGSARTKLAATHDQAAGAAYIKRQSYRAFQSAAIPFELFSEFVSSLMQRSFDGLPFPKYRYPSAGNLYPVQTYLYVKPQRVVGLAGGIYYYHPRDNELVLIAPDAQLGQEIHTPNNRALFEQCAFAILLIGQLGAVVPVYESRELALSFCMLEAGYISQLLMTTAPDCGIGLCPIGSLDFERIRPLFALDDDHVYLHSLLGGAIDPLQSATLTSYQESAVASTPVAADDIAEELRAFLATKLPASLIPSSFVLLESLPLTPNGKVDRKALIAAPELTAQPAAVYEAPRNEIEQTIAVIIQRVLGVEQVGIHDNFFDLGGHSLHIVQARSKLQEVFARDIPVVEMFKHPTVKALADFLGRREEQKALFEESGERAQTRQTSRERRKQLRQKD